MAHNLQTRFFVLHFLNSLNIMTDKKKFRVSYIIIYQNTKNKSMLLI